MPSGAVAGKESQEISKQSRFGDRRLKQVPAAGYQPLFLNM